MAHSAVERTFDFRFPQLTRHKRLLKLKIPKNPALATGNAKLRGCPHCLNRLNSGVRRSEVVIPRRAIASLSAGRVVSIVPPQSTSGFGECGRDWGVVSPLRVVKSF